MKNQASKSILVYGDWATLNGAVPLGRLTAQRIRGKEIFSFEYDTSWLSTSSHTLFLDPHIQLFPGNQYPPSEKINFGLFLDSSPDRWGRFLMRSREALLAKTERREQETLFESDYLLGVYDGSRMGGLRFKLDPKGPFLNDQSNMAAPPWSSLRELEHASLKLEDDEAVNDPEYSHWLNLLLAPGSSLGGARPKAGVLDEQGQLWIAKFPSHRDEKDSGAWEMVLHQLAKACGIRVPDAKLIRFSGKHHTFLSRRFDRLSPSQRIHFSSAMSLLGRSDGADHASEASYLEMATFILKHGCLPQEDLNELWKRILFNILVSNTDDHLRNHGFLLDNAGWRLAPAFDMNPDENGNGLTLNINHMSNAQDVSLVLDAAPYFRLTKSSAEKMLDEMYKEVRQWRKVARRLGLGNAEIERIRRAFRLADA